MCVYFVLTVMRMTGGYGGRACAVRDYAMVWLNGILALHGKSISDLQSVTCQMGSHSLTCHPTQVNAPRHNPNHAARYSIYLPRRYGRLS